MTTSINQIISVFHPAAAAAYLPSGAAPLPMGFAETGRIRSTAGVDFGFVAFDPISRTALIAIRGSETLDDWIHNVDAVPLPCLEGGLVHQGFRDAYAAIGASIHRYLTGFGIWPRLWITGHSLGGALAVLCGFDLRTYFPTVITFAGPRVGDLLFARLFDNAIADCTRVVNRLDIVPHLGTRPPYEHAGTELEVDGGFRPLDPKFAHSLDQYLTGLKTLASKELINA